MAGRFYVDGNEAVLTMVEDDVQNVPLHSEPEVKRLYDGDEDYLNDYEEIASDAATRLATVPRDWRES